MFSIFSSPDWLGNGSSLPLIHGGGDGDGMGLVGLLDSLLETINRGLEPGSSWNPIAGIAALGTNVHPLVVHFPIAFLVGFLLFEVAGLVLRRPAIRQAAGVMLYLGAGGAVLAAAAGLVAEATVPHGAEVHEIMEWHKRLGLTVAFLSVAMAIWRALAGGYFTSPMAQAFHLILAGIIAVCLFFGADLGGLMVYQYGVGVKGMQSAEESHRHQHEQANNAPHTHHE
ncbi:DUF2231 domain-containing protein [Methylomagnum sp.]